MPSLSLSRVSAVRMSRLLGAAFGPPALRLFRAALCPPALLLFAACGRLSPEECTKLRDGAFELINTANMCSNDAECKPSEWPGCTKPVAVAVGISDVITHAAGFEIVVGRDVLQAVHAQIVLRPKSPQG